ncbi:hypothetical protein [Congregibacter sp.]|uniref:hypothetical protein n=1 Tax=Congregibacter sp. TaxID=2744308 RepID=UPI00385C7872
MILAKIASSLRHRDWTDSFIEIGIVVLGILIAFQVEEFRQYRNDRAQERVLLLEVKSDLEATELDLQGDRKTGREILAGLDRLISDLLTDSASPISGTAETIYVMGAVPRLYPQSSGFESLKSAGLTLVSEADVRRGLSDLYTGIMPRVRVLEDILRTSGQTRLYPIYAPYVEVSLVESESADGEIALDHLEEKTAGVKRLVGISDMRVLAKDPRFTFALHARRRNYSNLLKRYNDAAETINMLITDVDRHLRTL